jgi:type II secretory pathway component PulF
MFSTLDWINPAAFHRSLNWAQFTELLALQLEHQSPLPRAFALAADATDDVRWQREAHAVASELSSGTNLATALGDARSMPPLVSWMLAAAEKQETLAVTLRQLSAMYRRRALQQAATLKTWIPVIMTICVTGGIGLAYGLLFFIPLRALLTGLMHE